MKLNNDKNFDNTGEPDKCQHCGFTSVGHIFCPKCRRNKEEVNMIEKRCFNCKKRWVIKVGDSFDCMLCGRHNPSNLNKQL